MPEKQYIMTNCCYCQNKNKNNIITLFKSISYCIICSTFIINNNTRIESLNKTIKPNNYKLNKDFPKNIIWNEKEDRYNYNFINKKIYMQYRSSIVKNMKKICSNFSLSLKTYFSSIEYLDKICSIISIFDKKILFQISLYCIILAAKFYDNKEKALEIQTIIKEKNSKNFSFDEIYVLKLLNYDLNINTSYDILMDILYYGFVFENEKFNLKKLNLLYKDIQKILYMFSESNSYINMSPKQIGICMIGFCRELLNLNPFIDNIKKIFMINSNNEKIYISGLNIIKKRIKIENEIKGDNNKRNLSNKIEH